MTRKQAENLARGNPAIAKRLKAGEFDNPPGDSTPSSGGSPGKRPARRTVRASAPPANPRGRSGASRAPSSRAARGASRDTDNTPPRRDGIFRSFARGLFD